MNLPPSSFLLSSQQSGSRYDGPNHKIPYRKPPCFTAFSRLIDGKVDVGLYPEGRAYSSRLLLGRAMVAGDTGDGVKRSEKTVHPSPRR